MMHKAIRNFLWTEFIVNMKVVVVSWDKCCIAFKLRGLGIKNLVILNKAILNKLAWMVWITLFFNFFVLGLRVK